jgi:conjugative transfer region protein TrbK
MSENVSIKPIVSAIAGIAVAAALLAAAVALNDAQVSQVQSGSTEPSKTVTGAFDAELARCNSIGPEAVNDAICKAVWEANRRRFFESRRSCSVSNAPKTAPQSPTTPAISPSPSSDKGRGDQQR